MGTIITIGREFGSGGRELGRRLAEELGIEYYDREIITEIAKHTELSETYISEVIDGKHHALYPITIGHSISLADNYALLQMQEVFTAQNKIICDLADKSDCVIVGRCADYILREKSPYKIFVYADMDSRIKRCLERETELEDYTERQMKKRIKRIDRNRAHYYSFYTGQRWADKSNYDMCINTTNTVIKDIVPIIAKMFK